MTVAMVLIAGTFVGVLSLLILNWLLRSEPFWSLPTPPTQPGRPEPLEILRIALTIVAGAGGLVALTVAYRRQAWLEADEVGFRERQKAFNDRYSAAAAQLGHDNPNVRLAGVYALANLANEWRAQRQQCVDVLCAYLRVPWDAASEDRHPGASKTVESRGPSRSKITHTIPSATGESEVRRTIIHVIAEHLLPPDPSKLSFDDYPPWQQMTYHLAASDSHCDNAEAGIAYSLAMQKPRGLADYGPWSDLTLDFTGATLPAGNFAMCVFGDVNFSATQVLSDTSFTAAKFTRDVSFQECEFSAGANFAKTCFSGSVNFMGSDLIDAHFEGATFTKAATFKGVRFKGVAEFSSTNFQGPAIFSSANFANEALFYESSFAKGATFSRTVFSEDARFVKATFDESARFSRAAFTQAAWFDEVQFVGDAWFDEIQVTGMASFVETYFSETAYFHQARFSGMCRFESAAFAEQCLFSEASFEGAVVFNRAVFASGADFTEVTFSDLVTLREASFSRNALFNGAGFAKTPLCTGLRLSEGVEILGSDGNPTHWK